VNSRDNSKNLQKVKKVKPYFAKGSPETIKMNLSKVSGKVKEILEKYTMREKRYLFEISQLKTKVRDLEVRLANRDSSRSGERSDSEARPMKVRPSCMSRKMASWD